MYRTYETTINLCIGDWPAVHDIDVTLTLDWDEAGDLSLLGVTCDTLPTVMIEPGGSVRLPHGQFLRSPLAQSVWSSAALHFAAERHLILMDLRAEDLMNCN